MQRVFKQVFGSAGLNHFTGQHNHHFICKGQRFGLIVGDINHGMAKLTMDLFQLSAQLPLQVRINNGQRLIKQNSIHIGAHQATAQRDFLFVIGTESARFLVSEFFQAQHCDGVGDTLLDLCVAELIDSASIP